MIPHSPCSSGLDGTNCACLHSQAVLKLKPCSCAAGSEAKLQKLLQTYVPAAIPQKHSTLCFVQKFYPRAKQKVIKSLLNRGSNTGISLQTITGGMLSHKAPRLSRSMLLLCAEAVLCCSKPEVQSAVPLIQRAKQALASEQCHAISCCS